MWFARYPIWLSVCRFVGQGLKVKYEHCQGASLRTYNTELSLNQMELLECLFSSETGNGGSQRGIQYTEVRQPLRHIAFALDWFMLQIFFFFKSYLYLFTAAPDISHIRQWRCATDYVPSPCLQAG